MSWRGLLSGVLALVALQAVLSTDESASRVGSGLGWIADLVKSALDPSVAAIPDLAGIGTGDDFTDGYDGGRPWWESEEDPFSGGSGGGNGGGGSW